MSKSFQILLCLSFAFIIIVVGNYVIAAQTTLTGTWSANDNERNWNVKNKDNYDNDNKDSKDKIYLNFKYQSSRGGDNSHGSTYSYNDIQDLTEAQANAANSTVSFRLAREAGTIECQGSFQNGKGAGTFRFTGNSQFVSAMKSRGFDFEKPSKYGDDREPLNRLFSAATLNVTTALADDLLSAKFNNLDVEDLFKATIFKINSGFMKEMAATGYPNLTMEDLVKARIFKIDAAFVRGVVAMGEKNSSFEDLVKYSIFKITPEYLSKMRSAGFNNLSTEQAVKLKTFNVTPEFVAEMRTEGLANLSVEQATKLKIFNINSSFVRQAKADGVPLEVEKLVQRRIGVWTK